ncbi:DUF4333 domain-containing protein [Nocardiopsis ganjiahuensis]|uniref:DUF4333 domain-containing protein n=1 Tax=Nocardiopsis ganjiahuensis TaxID=239984 RepID=UPI00034AD4C2|nr:DUF4333 domain-containing protein [Nocardiopsis ganjiahuensis]
MRQVKRSRFVTGAALGALPLLLVTGCSFDFSIGGPGSVSADEVAEKSSEILAEQVGQTPDDFTCSEDLPAEVGAEIRCELTHGGESIGATVTVTSVEDSEVLWDVVVDDAPADDTAAEEPATQDDSAAGEDSSAASASGGQVANTEVINQTTVALEAAGHTVDNFTCSDTHLLAQVGASLGCTFTENGVMNDITVTVTSVEGDTVNWDIHFDE